MPDHTPSTEFESMLRERMDVPEPDPQFMASLRSRFLSEASQLSSSAKNQNQLRVLMSLIHARPAVAMLIALLVLLTLSGVVYALGKVFGYIPGVGIVDQTIPLRILAEPVVMERDGLTVTISEVVADSEHTFVAYTLDGIVVPAMARPTCGATPALQLPDSSPLNILGIDTGSPHGARVGSVIALRQSVTYTAVPAEVNRVTFTLACILPEGTGPENWQIPLTLSPAPKDYATPAVEIGATFVASNPTFIISPTPTTDMRIFTPEPSDTLPATFTPVPNGSGLYLEKVIELPDSYILVGNFTDAGDLPGALEVSGDPNDDLPHIEDGAGNPVTFKVRADVQPEMGWGVRYWAFEIAKPIQGPLTITLDQINIAKFYTYEFQLDAGANPQAGQKWDLNLPVRLGSYEYVMDSVEVIENGYLFKYHSGTDIPTGTTLSFNLIGHTPELYSGDVSGEGPLLRYSEKLVYSPSLPTGQLTVNLTAMESVPLRGPWTLRWTPPSK